MHLMSRRSFAHSAAKGFAALGLASLAGSEIGCDLASVWANIQKYAPVGLSAFASILSILSGGGVVIAPILSAVVSLINTGFADLKAAVAQYQAAPAAQKQGYLGMVSEALTVLEANLQKFWSDLTIPDAKLSSLIQGLLGVITTTLMGFQTQLPAPVTPVAATAKNMRASLPRKIGGVPKVRSVHQFKSEFNKALADAGLSQHAI